MKTKAIVVERTQHSKGSGNGKFGGPDTYVAVLLVPNSAQVPEIMNRKVLKERGIKFISFGQGYSRNSGPTSMLGKARKEAEEYATQHNKE